MRSSPLALLLLLTLATGAVFALWPELDLMGAAFFHGQDGFPGDAPALKALRAALFFLPAAVMGAAAALWLAARLGAPLPERLRPTGRSLAFMTLSLALGPGLLVNVALKDHWHRPRPVQVQEFGGPLEFRPWFRTDGGCAKNCSFVSGETSGAFWLAAPASLAPPPLRLPAMAAALAIGALTGGLRVAFGGHFLSDALLAGLFTLLLITVLQRLIFSKDKQGLRGDDPHL